LAKTKPISKKELHEPDQFQALSSRIVDRVVENPRRAIIAAGSVLAAVLLVVLALYLSERAEGKGQEQLAAAAEGYFSAGDSENERAALEAELSRLADRHGGSGMGGEALYYLAGLRAGQGEYAAAAETYLKVREEHSRNVNLASSASLGLAYTYRLMGEGEKAIAALEELLEASDVPVPRDLVRFELAGLFEKRGEAGEAVSIYRSLAEGDAEGPLAEKARQRLSLLQGS